MGWRCHLSLYVDYRDHRWVSRLGMKPETHSVHPLFISSGCRVCEAPIRIRGGTRCSGLRHTKCAVLDRYLFHFSASGFVPNMTLSQIRLSYPAFCRGQLPLVLQVGACCFWILFLGLRSLSSMPVCLYWSSNSTRIFSSLNPASVFVLLSHMGLVCGYSAHASPSRAAGPTPAQPREAR